jgi:aryl-alcohol dehydrogenase-like predicted oxidoreductase
VGVIPWSPLARGRLARPWEAETTKRSESDGYAKNLYAKTAEADKRVADRVAQVAEARGVPMAQVALAWLLSKPAIASPIVGATRLHHLQDAVAAVGLRLTADEVKALEEPYVPHGVLGLS